MKRERKINHNYYKNAAMRRNNPDIRQIRDGKISSLWSDGPKATIPKSRKFKKKLRVKSKESNKDEVTENN